MSKQVKTEMGKAESRNLRLAPAVWIGFQPGFDDVPGVELYNLTEAIPGHGVGSTVGRSTLEQAGFVVAEHPEQKSEVRSQKSVVVIPAFRTDCGGPVAVKSISTGRNARSARSLAGFKPLPKSPSTEFGIIYLVSLPARVRAYFFPRLNRRTHRLGRWLAVSPALRRFA